MAWDHMEVRGNKCNPYTQDLLELDSYLPVAGQVSNKMLAKVNTPLQVTEWERAMASHPDREFVEWGCIVTVLWSGSNRRTRLIYMNNAVVEVVLRRFRMFR